MNSFHSSYDLMNTPPAFTQLALDRDVVAARHELPIRDDDMYDYQEIRDYAKNHLILQVKREVYSHQERMNATFELRVPKTWFDHVKLRWWPNVRFSRWASWLQRLGLQKYYEIQYETIPVTYEVALKCKYPTLPLMSPKSQPHRVYIRVEER